MTTTPESHPLLEAHMRRWHENIVANKAKLEQWLEQLKAYPQTSTCPKHQQTVALSLERTRRMPEDQIKARGPAYEPCPVCLAEAKKSELDKKHLAMGIPPLLLDAILDQLVYESENDKRNLVVVKQWAEQPAGFLLLLGGVGVGKSHIGAALIMQRREGLFVTQNGLLQKLRQTYHDYHADDFVSKAKRARLLVLDEVGVSIGGKDESLMLHDLIDYRYQHFLPTVITSNLPDEEFKAAVSDRIADRIRQAAAGVLRFCDASKRKASNSQYLEQARKRAISNAGSM